MAQEWREWRVKRTGKFRSKQRRMQEKSRGKRNKEREGEKRVTSVAELARAVGLPSSWGLSASMR